jgi:hypothetical protein
VIWAGLAYFVIRLLPFPFPLLAAPVEVILLVCINSPMYLGMGLLVDGSLQAITEADNMGFEDLRL